MDADDRALITRLFAEATVALEDAHALAVKGQSQKRALRDYNLLARDLRAAADEAAVLAQTAAVMVRRSSPKKDR